MPDANGDVYGTTLDIRLGRRSQSINGNAANPIAVDLRFPTTANTLGEIRFQPNTIVDMNGNVMVGFYFGLFEIRSSEFV